MLLDAVGCCWPHHRLREALVATLAVEPPATEQQGNGWFFSFREAYKKKQKAGTLRGNEDIRCRKGQEIDVTFVSRVGDAQKEPTNYFASSDPHCDILFQIKWFLAFCLAYLLAFILAVEVRRFPLRRGAGREELARRRKRSKSESVTKRTVWLNNQESWTKTSLSR